MSDPTSDEALATTELFQLLITTESLEQFLQELVERAARTIAQDVSAGITTSIDQHPVTVAASDAFAAGLDELQYAEGSGPCLQAMRTGQTVDVPDLAAAQGQWGAYGSHALAHGLGACLSTPLLVAGQTWGALNLYSPVPEKFSPQDRERAGVIATQAGTALAIAARIAEQTKLTEQFREALSSRAVIDHAVGIVMGAQHCTPDQAFKILRRASNDRNVKLRDIAAGIVASTSRPTTT